MAESILAYISGTTFFQNRRFDFFKFKKLHFWPIFFNFGGQKKFSPKIWHAKPDKVFLYHAEIQRNLMI